METRGGSSNTLHMKTALSNMKLSEKMLLLSLETELLNLLLLVETVCRKIFLTRNFCWGQFVLKVVRMMEISHFQ